MNKELRKKFLSFLLVLVITFTGTTPYFAVENKENTGVEAAIYTIQEMYPDSEIRVVDGELHVVVNEEPISVTRASEYAPNGGSYRNFKAPSYVTPEMVNPYSMVYLSAALTSDLVYVRNNQSIFNLIIQKSLEGLSAGGIATWLEVSKDIVISEAAIVIVITCATFAVMRWLDTVSMVKAQSNSSTRKIYIIRSSANGVYVNMYYPWNSNYVSASPFEDFNPQFYRNVYDIQGI